MKYAMNPIRTVLATCVLLACSASAFAGDLSGTWNVDGNVYGNAVKYACALKQDGEKLTGTATIEGKDYPVTGTVADKTVTWNFTIQYNGGPLDMGFTGTLETDADIKGKIAVAGVEGDFTAKRQ